jgi:hypothetical protein
MKCFLNKEREGKTDPPTMCKHHITHINRVVASANLLLLNRARKIKLFMIAPNRRRSKAGRIGFPV